MKVAHGLLHSGPISEVHEGQLRALLEVRAVAFDTRCRIHPHKRPSVLVTHGVVAPSRKVVGRQVPPVGTVFEDEHPEACRLVERPLEATHRLVRVQIFFPRRTITRMLRPLILLVCVTTSVTLPTTVFFDGLDAEPSPEPRSDQDERPEALLVQSLAEMGASASDLVEMGFTGSEIPDFSEIEIPRRKRRLFNKIVKRMKKHEGVSKTKRVFNRIANKARMSVR